mmetsp:Transcript_33700/g.50281  ORF Transcript_33700/g.50281 Transcript_33700/m.50281 type:complete len:337 (+) Transcript_33700:1-1011(+)
MMETVKARLKKVKKSHSGPQGAEAGDAEQRQGPEESAPPDAGAPDDGPHSEDSQQEATAGAKPEGCRLYPKLIDIRPAGESRSYGVKGSAVVDVKNGQGTAEFVTWAQAREGDIAAHGLRPMHVLLTAAGVMDADQRVFVQTLLENGIPCVCVLEGGYESLKPFFLEPVDGNDLGALAERAQEAKQLLQKGVGNLQSLWQKAPTRQNLWQRVAREGGPLHGRGLARAGAGPATFERAPVPPGLVGTLAAAEAEAAAAPETGGGSGSGAAAPAAPMSPLSDWVTCTSGEAAGGNSALTGGAAGVGGPADAAPSGGSGESTGHVAGAHAPAAEEARHG